MGRRSESWWGWRPPTPTTSSVVGGEGVRDSVNGLVRDPDLDTSKHVHNIKVSKKMTAAGAGQIRQTGFVN